MVLVLSVLRCPEQAIPEQRRVPGGEYVLGRGADCSWPLMDPDRVLSKRHCAVEYLSGAWQVRDLSTNGTFVNGASDPVGRDQVRVLRDGDRLRLGAYEIECRVEEESIGSGRWQSASAIPDPMAPPAAPASDIFSAPLPGLSPAGGPPGGAAPLLPADFDPFAPEDPGPVMPDHQPSTNDVFTPPRATMPDLLPGDWNAAPAPKPAAPSAPSADPFAHLPDPFADAPPGQAFAASPPAPPAAPPPAAGLDPFADFAPPAAPQTPAAATPDPFADLAPVPPPAFSPPPVAPVAPAARDPFLDVPAPPPAAPPPPVVSVAVAVTPAAAPAPSGDMQSAVALLFQAAGLPAPPPGTDPAAALAAAGAALRAAVSGMRALLIARADVKREFRIEQTMLRAAGNNPVKFAATDDQAVLAMLGPQGGGPAAIQETVQDLTAHQVATLAATQAAAKALLTRLSPVPLETEITSGGLMPGAREKKLWDAYRRLHQQVSDQFEDDFDSAFGKAFARAYEDAARKGG
ncbi:type VI secretion system-associated FHA domain protein TagH [Roseococcus sp. YIM B11640]|uniref:type VI secretion system-associated FHA domain protein TagH n=1 Tax=Roseococcus sp. YIM B11640 TaxID=3133973 RepID=UPI003C7E992B